MKHLLLLLLILPISLTAQLELVTDFNVGADDGFDCFLCNGQQVVTTTQGLLTVATTAEAGEELALIAGGELLLLKDINPGTGDGRIKGLRKFRNEIYFSAVDPANGGAIWTTDGTEAGTTLFYDPDPANSSVNVRVADFTFGEDGALYVALNRKLYRFSDGVGRELADNVAVSTDNDNFPGGSLTPYGTGVAYVSNESPDFGQGGGLFQATDTVRELGIIANQSDFDQAFGLREVNDNLIFTLESSRDARRGTWLYDAATDTLTRYLDAADEGFFISRWYDLSDSLYLGLTNDGDFYTFDGLNAPALFLTGNGIGAAARQEKPSLRVGDQLVWQTGGGVFADEQLTITDGTIAGTEVILEGRLTAFTNLIEAGGFVFFATEVGSAGPIPFYRYELATGTLTEITELPRRADNRNYDIQLLGVQDSLLYLALDGDENIGRELYSLELDVDIVSTSSRTVPELSVTLTSATYQINAERPGAARLSVFDLGGRLLTRTTVPVNVVHQLADYRGIRIYVFEYAGKRAVRRIVR